MKNTSQNDLIATLTYLDPPTFIMFGKKNPHKIYLTYNAIYSSPNYRVRIKIVELLKEYLLTKIDEIPDIDERVIIEVVYSHPGWNWDVDNKAGLWAKVFADLIKKVKIKEDSVRYIGRYVYDSDPGTYHKLTINIYKYV